MQGKASSVQIKPTPSEHAKEDFSKGNLLQQRVFSQVSSELASKERDRQTPTPANAVKVGVCTGTCRNKGGGKRERIHHPKIEKELNPWAAQPESSHGERFCRAAHHKSVNYRVFFTGNFRG